MKNTMDDIHSKILRKFHTLCGLCGMTPEEKGALVASFGVESSADIDTHDLIDICGKLSAQLGQKTPATMDRLRKQVFGSVGGYLRKMGLDGNAELIKSIACRSTGYDDFNRIPAERLRNVYYAFLNKQKDIDSSEAAANAVVMAGMMGVGTANRMMN